MRKYSIVLPLAGLLASGMVGCGSGQGSASGAARLGQVLQSLSHPTGSGKDKKGVISALAKQDSSSSNSATQIAMGGVGASLTAAGHGGFAPLSPRRAFGKLRSHYTGSIGFTGRGLDDEPPCDPEVEQCEPPPSSGGEESCLEGPEFQAAAKAAGIDPTQELDRPADLNYSFDASSCGSSFSGKIAVHFMAVAENNNLTLTLEVQYDNVCDAESNDCITGSYSMQQAMPSGAGGVVMAWDYQMKSKDEKGADREEHSKGGLRIGNDTNGSLSIEYVLYVPSDSGDEVSYVIASATDEDGNPTFEVRCQDGTLDCSTAEDDSGSCKGEVGGQESTTEWTSDEYETITDSEEFLEG